MGRTSPSSSWTSCSGTSIGWRNMSVKKAVPVLAILTIFSLAAAEAPKSWTPELSMKVQSVGDVTPSPDGRWVVWAQTHALMETEKSESVTQLFLARADESDRIKLTSGEKRSTRPRFAP